MSKTEILKKTNVLEMRHLEIKLAMTGMARNLCCWVIVKYIGKIKPSSLVILFPHTIYFLLQDFLDRIFTVIAFVQTRRF